MAYESNDKKMESVYGKRIKAGKRRTYFFDVRSTRGNDYFLTITESRKRFNDDGYDRHKIFLYKEDFNKFLKALHEAVDYVKTELMPNFDFDAYNHDTPATGEEQAEHSEQVPVVSEAETAEPTYNEPQAASGENGHASLGDNGAAEEVDKW
ncbi:MAG: DUF3276 family protein [Dinghuibacter sp.]|nr:DUF3276 family protein [Dinghuibacter sp.]